MPRMRAFLGIFAVLAVSCSSGSSGPAGPGPGGGGRTGGPPPDAGIVAQAPPDANPAKCAGPPPTPDHVCVQDCGPPVVRDTDPPPGWSWLSPDQVEARNRGGCPRCLPAEARIATPDGDVAIGELAVGARVHSLDRDGRVVEAVVLELRSTPAPTGHRVVRVTLADGRVVRGSAEHPVADGRELGALRAGDTLGDARVVDVAIVPLAGEHTWDLRVSGPTGLYLADGVPLRSTLEPILDAIAR